MAEFQLEKEFNNYEITEKQLNTGLRGFPVGTVRTSKVDPQQGVSYVGHSVRDLASLDPECRNLLIT